MLVAGLDVGGSSVKAWVQQVGGGFLASVSVPTATVRSGFRAEFDPTVWEGACRDALAGAVDGVEGEWVGLTVSSLRQGFVLLDGAGEALGPGVLNSDRRGGPFAGVLAGKHDLTGHWPAPELTLPKLLAVRAEEPERWARVRRVLFVHDWLLDRLTGVQVTEASYACSGGMADVARRTWAEDLLRECGVSMRVLAPIVEAGTCVGPLQAGWSLPAGVPVFAGCGDTQLAAMGAGGLAAGVVTVVAGSSTPVQAATSTPVHDPLGRPWVSTHAAPDLWAVEGNAGYPGTFSGWWEEIADADGLGDAGDLGDLDIGDLDIGDLVAVTAVELWSQPTWETKPPWSLVGLTPATSKHQVARALLESHAFSVAAAIEDLERVVGPATDVVVTGGAARDGALPTLLADVLGRDIRWDRAPSAAAAGTALVSGALELGHGPPQVPETCCPAGDSGPTAGRRAVWTATTAALRVALPQRSST